MYVGIWESEKLRCISELTTGKTRPQIWVFWFQCWSCFCPITLHSVVNCCCHLSDEIQDWNTCQHSTMHLLWPLWMHRCIYPPFLVPCVQPCATMVDWLVDQFIHSFMKYFFSPYTVLGIDLQESNYILPFSSVAHFSSKGHLTLQRVIHPRCKSGCFIPFIRILQWLSLFLG